MTKHIARHSRCVYLLVEKCVYYLQIAVNKWKILAIYTAISIFDRGPEVPKYQEVRGQAGRLGENRPIADHKECIKSCMSIIKEQVLSSLLHNLCSQQ